MKAACGLPTSLSLATGSYALSIALVPVVCPLHLASPHLSAGRDQGCLWAVDYSLPLDSVLLCGDDGIALLAKVEPHTDNRTRLPHAALGGFVR